MPNQQRPTPKPPQSSTSSNSAFLAVLVVLPLAVASFPIFLLLVIGMVPTYIALFLGPSVGRMYTALSVGGTNLCGILPSLVDLWQKGHDMNDLMEVLQDPLSWLIMYGASGIGWGLAFAMPPLFSIMIRASLRSKIRDQEKKQEELLKEWGENITNPLIM